MDFEDEFSESELVKQPDTPIQRRATAGRCSRRAEITPSY